MPDICVQKPILAAIMMLGSLIWATSGAATAAEEAPQFSKEADSRLIRTFGAGSWTAAFSPDGNMVLTVEKSMEPWAAVLWNVATGELIRVLDPGMDGTSALWAVFSPDSTKVFGILHLHYTDAGLDMSQVAWDANTGDLLYMAPLSGYEVWDMVASPDGTQLLLALEKRMEDNREFYCEQRSTDDGSLIRSFSIPAELSFGSSVAFSADNRHMLVSGSKVAIEYDTVAGGITRRFQSSGDVLSTSYSPDGGMILVGSQMDPIKLWDADTGVLIRDFGADSVGRKRICGNGAVFSPDGSKVAELVSGYHLTIWDVASGKALKTFSYSDGQSVAFSPDGTKILVGGVEATYLYDVTELGSGGCAGCAGTKSVLTLGGLKSRMGDLFLTGLTLAALAALCGRRRA